MTPETQAVIDRVREELDAQRPSRASIRGREAGEASVILPYADARTLLATIEALREDARRLDWLEGRPWASHRFEDGTRGLDYDDPECGHCGHEHDGACAAGDCECAAHANTDAPMHETVATSVRAAIDLARAARPLTETTDD